MKRGEKDSRPLSRRRGSLLIEVLILASVGGIILIAVAVLLAGVMQSSGRTTDAVRWQQTWQRLLLAWREDVHAAKDVNVGNDETEGESPAKATLTVRRADLSSATVVYIASPGRIVRRQQHDDSTSEEVFHLPPHRQARFEVDDNANIATIRLEPMLKEEQAKTAKWSL